ncbi:ABC transporter permease subunit [Aquihabitans daechungensis]|uniref:ABC transporter permease subunit n=1 Tax=Aquihabitans daechungensis TaxID=1052257 RepID=UPI003B9F9997
MTPRERPPRVWVRSVFGRSFHEQRRALLGWSVGAATTVLLELALYPTVRDSDMSGLLDSYPETVKKLFGLTDLSTGTGYVRAELVSLVLPMLLVIPAILWGSDAIAGEEDRRTIDLLLANPVSRRRIVLDKVLCLLGGVVGVGAAVLAALLLGNALFSVGVAADRMLSAVVMTAALGIVFGLVALAAGAATGRRGFARGVAATLAVGAYLLSSLAPLAGWLEPWQGLSPWYHALGIDPLRTGLPAVHLAVLALLAGAAVAIGAITFDRRDIAV